MSAIALNAQLFSLPMPTAALAASETARDGGGDFSEVLSAVGSADRTDARMSTAAGEPAPIRPTLGFPIPLTEPQSTTNQPALEVALAALSFAASVTTQRASPSVALAPPPTKLQPASVLGQSEVANTPEVAQAPAANTEVQPRASSASGTFGKAPRAKSSDTAAAGVSTNGDQAQTIAAPVPSTSHLGAAVEVSPLVASVLTAAPLAEAGATGPAAEVGPAPRMASLKSLPLTLPVAESLPARGQNVALIAASAAGSLAGEVPMSASLHAALKADSKLGLRSFQARTHLAPANAISFPANGSDAAARSAKSAIVDPTSPKSVQLATADIAIAATGAAFAGPISLANLPQLVAHEASYVTSRSAPAPPTAPTVVKEIEIWLDPVDLGAITLKMRLANGKLSVVIAIANPSTRVSVESQRSEIVGRLSVNRLAPEDLVIQPQASPTNNGEPTDVADFNANRRSDNPQSDQARSEQGGASNRNQQPAKTDDCSDDLIV